MKISTLLKSFCFLVLGGCMSVANAQIDNLLKDLKKAAKDFEKGIQYEEKSQGGQQDKLGAEQNSSLRPQNQSVNKQLYQYVSSSNACSLYSKTVKQNNTLWGLAWVVIERDLQELNDLKVITTEQALSNLASDKWVIQYNLSKLREHVDSGYNLNQFQNDLPRVISWFKSKQSGGSCPWGMPVEEVAFIVQWVLGDYWLCEISGDTIASCLGKSKGFHNVLENVRNIKLHHESEVRKAVEQENWAKYKEEQRRLAELPEGKTKALIDKYVAFMTVQDCHEIRKSYAVQYVDANTFGKARSAMKAIETRAKSGLKGLNTDAVWAEATKQYSSSLVGKMLDINKKAPQNHTKENQGMCNFMVMQLLDAVPKEVPKKSF